MIRDISIDELKTIANPVLIDVRSESEFAEATIPGAINLPLFNDAERAAVGTTYTQDSPSQARELGLRIVSPKLPELVAKATEMAKSGPLVLFCWRGGMRSKSLAAILDLMNISVYRIQGGYKAYRRKVVEFFQTDPSFAVVVLRGNTGVGKTELLGKLRQDGYPAIDIEKLANNRGSVFGALGLGAPPTQKTFEGLLYEEIVHFKGFPYVIVECESKRIGRVTLPESFFTAMQKGTQVLVYDSMDNRVDRLIQEYTSVPDAMPEIDRALERLTKMLGHEKINAYRQLLAENRLAGFTERLLVEYYDLLYQYPNEPDAAYDDCFNHEQPEDAVRELERYLDEKFA